jgi:ATPase subunit of ABC transporter with duplicated ATPase domains
VPTPSPYSSRSAASRSAASRSAASRSAPSRLAASRGAPSRLERRSTIVARDVTHDRGGRTVLDRVSLVVGPGSRIGMVGPNGAGKSTLLQVLAGQIVPDEGTVRADPPSTTIGYLSQEHDARPGETVRRLLGRRTGVAEAELDLREAASAVAEGVAGAAERYEVALERLTSLGVGDLDVRIDRVLEDIGLGATLADCETTKLSGGQQAKVALAGVELSQFDVTLLDEPTNDLDFDGLRRLEEWVSTQPQGMVIVSHDREFLERTVTSVLELDGHSHRSREYGGGWAGYESERRNVERQAEEAYERYERRRTTLEQRAQRQREWATAGVRKEARRPRDHDTAQRDFRLNRTEKLASKARRTERALASLEEVAKPWTGWDLRFRIEETRRAGDVVARLVAAVVDRGPFRLGPIDLEVAWGERVGLTGANGVGKSSLVGALLGRLPLASGARWFGPGTVVGELGQDRRPTGSTDDLVRSVMDRCGLVQSEARSLLAKFGLGADHVGRPTASLSPGERTRAELAVFQALGVNFLVLDEPTNHLDLQAIEELESALANFGGTLLLVSHDRRMLAEVGLTREIELR